MLDEKLGRQTPEVVQHIAALAGIGTVERKSTDSPASPSEPVTYEVACYRLGLPKRNLVGRFAVSADDVAAVIARAAGRSRPRARYRVGFLARMLIVLRTATPAISSGAVRTTCRR